MTVFIIPIFITDILLLIWIMGHMPRRMYFPELNLSVLLMVPLIIGIVIYHDLERSFGLFNSSDVPLFQHPELYMMFSFVFLGFYAVVSLAIQYYEHQSRRDIYYEGIRVNINRRTWLSTLLIIVLVSVSIMGILRFYVDHNIYQ
jgi:hypothetical protein